jgi:hypothetical protein
MLFLPKGVVVSMFFGLSSSFEETYCVFCGTLGTIKRGLCALFDAWDAVEQQIFLGNDNRCVVSRMF